MSAKEFFLCNYHIIISQMSLNYFSIISHSECLNVNLCLNLLPLLKDGSLYISVSTGALEWTHRLSYWKLAIWHLNKLHSPLTELELEANSYNPRLFQWAMHAKLLQLCPTLCDTVDYTAHQVPLSLGFSRQEYWTRLPFPTPRDLPDPGIELTSLISPALAGGFFTTSATWESVPQQTIFPSIFTFYPNINKYKTYGVYSSLSFLLKCKHTRSC